MSSIKSSITKEHNNAILGDKSFITKLALLLVSIIIVSLFGILQSGDTFSFENSSFSSLKLETIEKNLNGNSINLNVVENDFDGLSELDLSDIELVDLKIIEESDKKIVSSNTKIKVNTKIKEEKRVFITSGSIKSLSFIKKKFYATNNIAFSLLISEKFLKSRKYKKALKWALISNEINDKNEDSWILFAKAKVKMNKNQDAINALSAYLKNNNSANVKSLLDDISKRS